MDREQIGQMARSKFKEKNNCAESVVKAFIETGLIDFPEQVSAAATGFGGGIGKSGHNCGALTGAVIALGLKKGRISPNESIAKDGLTDLSGKPGVYRAVNYLPTQFQNLYGTVDCSELVKHFEFDSKERKEYCAKLVQEAAEIAYDVIENFEHFACREYDV